MWHKIALITIQLQALLLFIPLKKYYSQISSLGRKKIKKNLISFITFILDSLHTLVKRSYSVDSCLNKKIYIVSPHL